MEMVTMKFLLLLITATLVVSSRTIKETYIVRMDKSQMPTAFNHQFQWYDSILNSVTVLPEVLYKYDTVMDGLSTTLTSKEAESLENLPGVLSVIPDQKYELHTTRTPVFLGLIHGPAPPPFEPKNASKVIVGLLDSGVWPEHKSFDDTGLGPVPSSWKGSCDEGDYFNASSSCNRKLIGARYFYQGSEVAFGPLDSKSPRDYEGHGTHTSSTAAGSVVRNNASFFGLAPGEAQGMAPRARIAAYKVCWGERGCMLADVLAGMEKAIEDGVHVISISLGGYPTDYYKDTIAIGAFAAMSKGIFVSCSAGNSGPEPGFVTNIAPWITTVGAGTLDRDFPTNITLGNGKVYTGVSLYNEKPFMESPAPLVYDKNCYSEVPEVKGKVVVCDRSDRMSGVTLSKLVKDAGGIGLILANTEGEEVFIHEPFFLPSAAVGKKAGDAIRNYTASSDPTAIISPATTKLGVQPSPKVVEFSSRGPNQITPEILKPDIVAPGFSILAGWTATAGPTDFDFDNRNITFNIISGTSMSCPHTSGLAILLKAEHPEWSPAAIRSALMTTAYTVYKNGKPILDRATERPATPFDYGSGHVDPVAANNPGLVYDLSEEDYLGFLCALNYNASQIKSVTNKNFTCDPSKEYSLAEFNYPSFAVVLDTSSTTAKYTRTLTNVGPSSSSTTYNVSVSFEDPSVEVSVEPSTLTFSKQNEKQSYTVTFETTSSWEAGTSFGSLIWSDSEGKHKVRSPIAFTQIDTDKKIPVI